MSNATPIIVTQSISTSQSSNTLLNSLWGEILYERDTHGCLFSEKVLNAIA
jgi:hypothetical protein